MQEKVNEYGIWPVVIFAILFFSIFVIGFFKPRKKREWRNLGIFEAFIVALYAEMYGFPFTIYILSTFFGVKIPLLHIKGHLWASLFNLSDNAAAVICSIGSLFMVAGLIIIGMGWRKIYKGKNALATDGLYKHIRHPQYLGLFLIITGMLIQWPTILTIIMWPVLIFAYWYLAKLEEKELEEEFGAKYILYKKQTGMFFPRFEDSGRMKNKE